MDSISYKFTEVNGIRVVNLSNVKAVQWADRAEMPVNPLLGRFQLFHFEFVS